MIYLFIGRYIKTIFALENGLKFRHDNVEQVIDIAKCHKTASIDIFVIFRFDGFHKMGTVRRNKLSKFKFLIWQDGMKFWRG